MPPTAPPIDRRAADAAARASALDARGDHEAAGAVWREALEHAPAAWPIRLGHALARLRAGAWREALPALAEIAAALPGHPAPRLGLAQALSAAGRHDDAIAAASRAADLAPANPAVHAGMGDVLRGAGRYAAAVDAYRRALALAPADADLANKHAGALRASGRLEDARAALDAALADHPRHPLLRVNRATLAAATGDVDEARDRLREALGEGPLPPAAQVEARDTLALIGEYAALAPAVRVAADERAPVALARALAARPPNATPDEDAAACIARFTMALREAVEDEAKGPRSPLPADWPAIEAATSAVPTRGADPPGRAETLAAIEREDRERYEGLARKRDELGWPPADAVAFEAILRTVHAVLTGHRPDHLPGSLKLAANVVPASTRRASVAPAATRATLAAAFAHYAALAPGLQRASWLHATLALIHPFQDGNGRTIRFLVNTELLLAGSMPYLPPGDAPRRSLGPQLDAAFDGAVGDLVDAYEDGRAAAGLARREHTA